jgi:hypothetical protein
MPKDQPDRRHLRLVTNEELRDLIQSRTSNGFVNMLHPLELDIPRDVLDQWTRTSLQALRDELSRAADSARAEIERGIQQRVDFLAWLQTQEQDQVFMAIYPADMDGLDDLDDLDEVIENLPPDLPF